MKDNIKLRDENIEKYLCDIEVRNCLFGNIKHSQTMKIKNLLELTLPNFEISVQQRETNRRPPDR